MSAFQPGREMRKLGDFASGSDSRKIEAQVNRLLLKKLGDSGSRQQGLLPFWMRKPAIIPEF
jgi:hypothetical protein